ncbi:MAG: nickel transporter [Gemmatimonadota bacterium]|nr:MAG: nickel transporter [Gemmatimonadota bacterium]
MIQLAPVVAGLIAGAAHVFTGADHMAAVAPLAIEQRRRPWLAGLLWGIGHSGGVWLLAIVALLAREALPLDAISSWSERLVGIVLIAVGVWGLHRVLRLRVHTHTHEHVEANGTTKTHEHTHVHATRPHEAPEAHKHHPEHAVLSHSLLGIGALHGLAGTAHLLGVLPALAMPSRASAAAYVISFGIGSIFGMAIFTGALGALVKGTGRFGRTGVRMLLTASSTVAIVVGIVWMASTL